MTHRWNASASLAGLGSRCARLGRRATVLTSLLVALILFAVGPADALDGVSGEFADTEGKFVAACEELRNITGVDGDVVLICDGDREGCRLVSLGGVNEGDAIGFCEDSVEGAVRPLRDTGETNVTINSTAYGGVTGLLEDGEPTDLVCETFERGTALPSPGVKVCRKVVPDLSNNPVPDGPNNCESPQEFIRTVGSSDACDTLQALVAGTVSLDAFQNISSALFIDVDAASQPGSKALLVCPGFDWQCADPGQTIPNATVEYEVPEGVINTPRCIWYRGTCYAY